MHNYIVLLIEEIATNTMRVATFDGLVTLFYDGSRQLYNDELDSRELVERARVALGDREDISNECKEYMKERLSWEQIVGMEGVTEIPERTFHRCENIKRVIFANTVVRIGRCAFARCTGLVFVKWSINLEYIGEAAFNDCNLSSVFIPPRCREIRDRAFQANKNLSIFHVPQDTELGRDILERTAIARASRLYPTPIRFRTLPDGELARSNNMNQWLKNMNNDDTCALHRACTSYQPLKEVIHTIIQEKGLKAFRQENDAGITPSQYLKENPYSALTEKEIIREYLMKAMGEVE